MKDTTELELEIMELEDKFKLSRNETDKLVLHETIMKKKAELEKASKEVVEEKPVAKPVTVNNNNQKPAEKKEDDKKNNVRGEITNSGDTFAQNKDANKSEEKKN